MHSKCILMYVIIGIPAGPASRGLDSHPPFRSLHAYAGDPSAVGVDLDARIRRVLSAGHLQPPSFKAIHPSLPPKPLSIRDMTMARSAPMNARSTVLSDSKVAHPLMVTLQDERDAAVNRARDLSAQLEATQAQLLVQQSRFAEIEPLRQDVTRFRELLEDRTQKISELTRSHERYMQTATMDIKMRDYRWRYLKREATRVPGLQAVIQAIETRVAGEIPRRDPANAVPRPDVPIPATEPIYSREDVKGIRMRSQALVQLRDAALDDLAKARKDIDALRGQTAELEMLRARVEELVPFEENLKVLAMERDALLMQVQRQKVDPHMLPVQVAESGPSGECDLDKLRRYCTRSAEQISAMDKNGIDTMQSEVAKQAAEHEGHFTERDKAAVKHVESMSKELDAMGGTPDSTERRVAKLEATKLLESVGASMVPSLVDALIQIAEMATTV
ncbi:unnamed protein product [Peniophora sp. CBMAI 1063]|nr:unnamed protein product [Peniophora sp. CBMAI 1063]